jgi:HD superfamily phosphohydrolase YqeK
VLEAIRSTPAVNRHEAIGKIIYAADKIEPLRVLIQGT